jgi:hypothetical protein
MRGSNSAGRSGPGQPAKGGSRTPVRLHRWQRRILDRAAYNVGALSLSDSVATFATTLAVHLLSGGAMPNISPTHEVRVHLDSPDKNRLYVMAFVVPVGDPDGNDPVGAIDQWQSAAVARDREVDPDGELWDSIIDAELDKTPYLRVAPTLLGTWIGIVPVVKLPASAPTERTTTQRIQ